MSTVGGVMTSRAHSFDMDQAKDYLLRRFGSTGGGNIAMAVRFNGRRWCEYPYEWPKEVPKLLRDIKQLEDKKADIYICPIPRKGRDREQWDGLPSRTVFADLDGGQVPDALVPYVELINSGTTDHYHAYINLTKPVSVEELVTLNFAFTRASDGDKGKWPDNTLLRLPGTINYKNEPLPVVLNKLAEKSIDPEELKHALKYYLPTGSAVAKYDELFEVDVSGVVNSYLLSRLEEPAFGDRSNQSYHFILACYEKGLDKNQIYTLALKHAPTVEKYGNRVAWQVNRVEKYVRANN